MSTDHSLCLPNPGVKPLEFSFALPVDSTQDAEVRYIWFYPFKVSMITVQMNFCANLLFMNIACEFISCFYLV